MRHLSRRVNGLLVRKAVIVIFLLVVVGFMIALRFEMTTVSMTRLLPSKSEAVHNLDDWNLCNEDCTRFRSLMSNNVSWPNERPRSAVVVLIGRRINIPSLNILSGG
jgi:hypothetical protein